MHTGTSVRDDRLQLLEAGLEPVVPPLKDKIYVAMSGGVDSSVAAALLKRDGYDVHGVFMRNWRTDGDDDSGRQRDLPGGGGCSSAHDWRDVQAVCAKLEMPCSTVDLSREYWTRVFEPALRLYEQGLTPNPDIGCNRDIKFGALLEHIRDRLEPQTTRTDSAGGGGGGGEGAKEKCKWWLATGHYARLVRELRYDTLQLMRPVDRHKDQSYFLSTVEPSALERAYFPLATHTKSAVRALAAEFALPVADKRESQGLCFVSPETRRFRDFLSSYLSPAAVRYVDLDGTELARDRRGLWSCTVGERSGLQLDQGTPALRGRWYVARKSSSAQDAPPALSAVADRAGAAAEQDAPAPSREAEAPPMSLDVASSVADAETNEVIGTVTLVKGRNHPALYAHGCVSTDWQWADYPASPDKLLCQLRHRGNLLPADQRRASRSLELGAAGTSARTTDSDGDGGNVGREGSAGETDDEPRIAVDCLVRNYAPNQVGVFFREPQFAVTPGQHLAVYSGQLCIGGGTVLAAIEGLRD